jgi:hypothetical protein
MGSAPVCYIREGFLGDSLQSHPQLPAHGWQDFTNANGFNRS